MSNIKLDTHVQHLAFQYLVHLSSFLYITIWGRKISKGYFSQIFTNWEEHHRFALEKSCNYIGKWGLTNKMGSECARKFFLIQY